MLAILILLPHEPAYKKPATIGRVTAFLIEKFPDVTFRVLPGSTTEDFSVMGLAEDPGDLMNPNIREIKLAMNFDEELLASVYDALGEFDQQRKHIH